MLDKDYNQEARCVRAVAADMKNPLAKEQLLLIADIYEKLATICGTSPPSSTITPRRTRSSSHSQLNGAA